MAAVEVAADPQWGEGPHQLRASFQAQPRLPQTMCSTITSGVLRSQVLMLFSLKKPSRLTIKRRGFSLISARCEAESTLSLKSQL